VSCGLVSKPAFERHDVQPAKEGYPAMRWSRGQAYSEGLENLELKRCVSNLSFASVSETRIECQKVFQNVSSRVHLLRSRDDRSKRELVRPKEMVLAGSVILD
jgi:hypothetical protein